jgi:hypothetical protein
MREMPLDQGISFLIQVTGNWILACPEESIVDLGETSGRTSMEKFQVLYKAFYYWIVDLLSRAA